MPCAVRAGIVKERTNDVGKAIELVAALKEITGFALRVFSGGIADTQHLIADHVVGNFASKFFYKDGSHIDPIGAMDPVKDVTGSDGTLVQVIVFDPVALAHFPESAIDY